MNIYAYIKIDTNEYPVFQGDLRNICLITEEVFPCPAGYAEVYDLDPPENSEPDHYLVELPPVNIAGKFTRNFIYEYRAPLPIQPNIKPFIRRHKPKESKPIFPTEATGMILVEVI